MTIAIVMGSVILIFSLVITATEQGNEIVVIIKKMEISNDTPLTYR